MNMKVDTLTLLGVECMYTSQCNNEPMNVQSAIGLTIEMAFKLLDRMSGTDTPLVD